jgi:hypothetical protein
MIEDAYDFIPASLRAEIGVAPPEVTGVQVRASVTALLLFRRRRQGPRCR